MAIVQKLNQPVQSCDWSRRGAACQNQAATPSRDFVEWFPARQGLEKIMTVFLIADIKVTDGGWVPDYAANVHKLVEKHGGKYLSRSGKIETVEGADKDSSLIALIEFPSRSALSAFAGDPEYAPYGKARQAGSISNFHVIDNSDIAGTIPYLPAG